MADDLRRCSIVIDSHRLNSLSYLAYLTPVSLNASYVFMQIQFSYSTALNQEQVYERRVDSKATSELYRQHW